MTKPGKCRIRIQSSVEHLHTLRTPDRKKKCGAGKEQHRFNMELVYIQDITKIRDGETAIGVSCPHCGGSDPRDLETVSARTVEALLSR